VKWSSPAKAHCADIDAAGAAQVVIVARLVLLTGNCEGPLYWRAFAFGGVHFDRFQTRREKLAADAHTAMTLVPPDGREALSYACSLIGQT
jgi:hypothetical protein